MVILLWSKKILKLEVEERETKDDVSRNWDTFLSLVNTYICAKKRDNSFEYKNNN